MLLKRSPEVPIALLTSNRRPNGLHRSQTQVKNPVVVCQGETRSGNPLIGQMLCTLAPSKYLSQNLVGRPMFKRSGWFDSSWSNLGAFREG
jgi:hypothetical protein